MNFPKHYLFSFVFAFLSQLVPFTAVFAQDDTYSNPESCENRRGIEYGGLAGFFFANRTTAGFYSGKPGNENNVEYVFRNKYWYNEIYELLGANDTVVIAGYPDKMKYTPSFSFGLFAKWDRDCHTGFYLQFSYVKLQAKDVVTLEVDPKEYLTEPDIRLCPVYGTEERNMVDLGFNHAFGDAGIARLTLGGGISMNNSLVKESVLRIESRSYNLVKVYGNNSYIPGGTQQAYEIRQGGIGFGLFGTLGARFEFSPAIAVEPGIMVRYEKIVIDPTAGFTPQINLFLKIAFRDLLSFSE